MEWLERDHANGSVSHAVVRRSWPAYAYAKDRGEACFDEGRVALDRGNAVNVAGVGGFPMTRQRTTPRPRSPHAAFTAQHQVGHTGLLCASPAAWHRRGGTGCRRVI